MRKSCEVCGEPAQMSLRMSIRVLCPEHDAERSAAAVQAVDAWDAAHPLAYREEGRDGL